MRAILLLLMAAGCGGKPTNVIEFDVGVTAPAAAAVVVDGTAMLPPTGGSYARGYPSLADAMKATGTIESRESNGTVRASTTYAFGSNCAAVTPLLRQTQRFLETSDATGAVILALDSIECVRTDGTGVIESP